MLADFIRSYLHVKSAKIILGKIKRRKITTKIDWSLSNYASVPMNNNLKSKLCVKFSYICCIFSREASTSG